jgi:superfamily I DNA/RNA helicase/GNAT superfamily N-acetyltransferase/ssDNA-binding Zn-finger/Zn-ribbon topoisomerase 1
MTKRKGPYGEFFGCSKYPVCKGVRKIGPAPQGQPQQPVRQNPAPVQQPQAPAVSANKTWVLATLIKTGEPIVVSKVPAGWEYQKESGESGIFPSANITNIIKSVTDATGQKITDKNVKALFKKYKEINGLPTEEEAKPQEDSNAIPGRIPNDRLSDHQRAIQTSFTETQSSLMINALAGTGKTSTLRHLASFKNPNEKWLYLVFNKKNQVEASSGKGKFPDGVEVMTSHSFLGRVLGRSGDLNAIRKTDLYNERGERISVLLDEMMKQDRTFPQGVIFMAKKIIKQVASLAKAFAIIPGANNSAEAVSSLIDKYGIDTNLSINKNNPAGQAVPNYKAQIVDKVLDLLYYCLPGNSNVPQYMDMRDHDDTLWYAAINDNIQWPHYDVVLADEVQDFNTCQTIMLKKLSEAGARVVAVGDPNQCQPAGTVISLTGGSNKFIEEIQPGDEVVTYNSKKSYFPGVKTQGRKVINVSSRIYNGDLIKIDAGNYSHECTTNHKCVVKFNQEFNNNYVTYLMIKGENARIGIAKIKYFQSFGPSMRARQEDADKMWVLDVHSSVEEARSQEIYLSCLYNLPQIIFKHNGQKTGSQEFIDLVYNKVGNNIEGAIRCLEKHGRDYNFPLWVKEDHERYGSVKQNYIGSKKSFVTQACNLVSDAMEVRTFDGSSKGGSWTKIKVTRKTVQQIVYSLEVEPTEDGKKLYIANGIVTHNSIYMFRGADTHAFENVQQMLAQHPLGNVPHELPVNYRSGRKIIEYVNKNTKVKNLVAGKNFDGEVQEGVAYDEAMERISGEKRQNGRLAEPTAFIARTNTPLIKTALSLMKDGIDFIIIGRDFSKELTDHIENITGKGRNARRISIQNLSQAMDSYLAELEYSWANQISKEAELREMKSLTESLNNIILHLSTTNYEDHGLRMRVTDSISFIEYLKKKFAGVNLDNAADADQLRKKDPLSYVTLTSAHRSKGLEFDRLFVLEPQLFPHPKAKTPDEKQQEENAWYVTLTRAMKSLTILAPSLDDKKKENKQASKKSKNWYKKSQNDKEPWQVPLKQYLDNNYKGHISSDAYDSYRTSEGLDWLKYERFPALLDTLNIKGKQVEIRKDTSKNKFGRKDENGEYLRDSSYNLIYLTDEEVLQAGLPLEDGTIAAFVNKIPIGFASNEFGTSGVWVVEEYQKQGLGKRLLQELHKAHPRLAKKPLGQMTPAGFNLSKSYHKYLVQKALKENQNVPSEVLNDYSDINTSPPLKNHLSSNNWYLNIRMSQLISGLKIIGPLDGSGLMTTDEPTVLFEAKVNEESIGYILVIMPINKNPYVGQVTIKPNYRLKGIATALYNKVDLYLKENKKLPLKPSRDLSPGSQRIWEKRLRDSYSSGKQVLSQNLTPAQMNLYTNFKTPAGVNVRGSGLSSVFRIPGTNQTLTGGQIMNQVLGRIQSVLTKYNVHTIDTNPISKVDAIGVAISSEPGTIHVDISKIFNRVQGESQSAVTQLDGVEVDPDIQKDIVMKMSQILLHEIANTSAHEAQHNQDYINSFPQGQFQSSESGAENFGNNVANQYFKL